jgi:nuclear pore complex protein Nup205
LNELVCVELLVAAVERGAPPEQCLRPAAGMFLRERQNRVECLERLLREKQRYADAKRDRESRGEDTRLARVVDACARDILTGVNGGRTLIGRLCEILASPYPGELAAAAARASGAYIVQTPGGGAATPGGGAAQPPGDGLSGLLTDAAIAAAAADMTHVVDERGRACRKKDWLAHERKLLAECLFRAVALAKREPPAEPALATRDDFEALARLFAETASPALATAAADVRARAAAMESGAAVGPGGPFSQNGAGPPERSVGPGSSPFAARGGRLEEAPSAAEARVGCVDELGDLAAGVADELPAALAILFATLEAVTPGDGEDAGASPSEAAAAAAAAAAVGPALEAASAAAAAQFRRARDGDDADAAAEMAAANPLRSAALGGGFGGLMFGRSQDRSAADDAATEVSGARVGVLELARFARGLTLLSASGKAAPATAGGQTEAAKKEIVAASDDGALVALRCVLATGAFRDEAEASRRAYLALARETLRRGMRAALADADLGEALAAVTPAMTADQIAREERHAATADDAARSSAGTGSANGPGANLAFDAYGNPAYGDYGDASRDVLTGIDVHVSEGERLRAMREDEDSVREAPLAALCRALAEVYRQSPESAREDAAPATRGGSGAVARAFLDAICEWEHGVESLSAALEVLAALAASGDAGARDAWERLRAPPAGAAVAWDHFLGAVAGYNRRFAFGEAREDETEHAYYARGLESRPAPAKSARIDREMPEADARGMVAYLEVLTNCLGGGEQKVSPAEARDRVAWLSQRCAEVQGPPGSFLDALMRLHANPVPSRLKAALLACAGAASGDGAAGAAETWARMEAAAILQTNANTGGGGAHSMSLAFETRAGYDAGVVPASYGDGASRGTNGFSHGFSVSDSGIDSRENAFDGRDAGYGAAAAARQRLAHERAAREGAERATVLRDQLAVPGADLAYEFAHSEASARVYPHAHAYVRLVNRLMRACEASRGGPCAGAGRAARAQFVFIRDRVFGELRRRRHRSQEERWWLARDALTHFRIQLRVWRDAVRSGDEAASPRVERVGRDRDGASGVETGYPYAPSATGGFASVPSEMSAPGAEIMADFMTDGPLFRGVCAVLAVGAERLAAERAAAHGAALEATAAEALALLADALALDAATLAETRKSLSGADADDAFGGSFGSEAVRIETSSDGSFRYGAETNGEAGARASAHRRIVAMRAETVDRSLLRDPSVCACVLGFSRYRFDPNVPLRAIQILAVLSERNERLLDLLPASAVEALAEGAAGALELASSASKAPGSAPVSVYGNSAPYDEREEDAVAAAGAAVLDVILDALPRRAPNVAHALLGFDPALDPSRAALAPFGEKFTCLTVLLELLEASPPGACAGDLGAEPPEAAARVLFELVADERTAPAALEAVTNWPPGAPGAQQRLALLAADALAAPPPADPRRRAAAAHHRAWLLRVAAAALDYCAPRSSNASVPFETLDDLPPLAAALARAATRSDSDPAAAFAEHADDDFSRAAVEKPRLAALETLATIPAPPLPPLAAAARELDAFLAAECSSGRGASAEETRAARAALGAEALLSDRRPVAAGGCFEVTSRGDAVVSVPALGARLLENSNRLARGTGFGNASSSPGRLAHKLAVRSAVRQARAFNAAAEEHAAHAHLAGAWAEFVALVAARCLPSGDAARMDDLGPQDVVGSAHPERASEILFALAEGVLARLASPTPRTPQIVSTANGELRGELADGGGDAWWRALDLPLARLAATLLTSLRDGAEAKTSLSGEEEEEEESDEGGPSRAAAAASRALDASVGGGAPGGGVTDAAAFAAGGGSREFGPGLGAARGIRTTPLDPSRCKALLRGVLGALRRGEASRDSPLAGGVALDVEARACAYECMLAFLQYARPVRSAAGRFPRSVLRLAEGEAKGFGETIRAENEPDVSPGLAASFGNSRTTPNDAAEAETSPRERVSIETERARAAARAAARAQDELEAGVGALLRRDAPRLVDILGRDIADPAVDDATRAAALAVAEALLAAAAASGSAAGERAGAFGPGGGGAGGGGVGAGAIRRRLFGALRRERRWSKRRGSSGGGRRFRGRKRRAAGERLSRVRVRDTVHDTVRERPRRDSVRRRPRDERARARAGARRGDSALPRRRAEM